MLRQWQRDRESAVSIRYGSHHHIREHGDSKLCVNVYVNFSANDRVLVKCPNSVLYVCLTQRGCCTCRIELIGRWMSSMWALASAFDIS